LSALPPHWEMGEPLPAGSHIRWSARGRRCRRVFFERWALRPEFGRRRTRMATRRLHVIEARRKRGPPANPISASS
jgi:hypothetical protein